MNAADRFLSRIADAFGGMMLTLVVTVGGIIIQSAQEATPATEPATSMSIELMTGLVTSLPGIITLLGIAGATVIAGPFGFVGALLEVVGVNLILYYQNPQGFWTILFGAGLVTAGVPVPWMRVLEWIVDSNGQY